MSAPIKKIRRRGPCVCYLSFILCLICIFIADRNIHAKEFPERAITMIVNTTPGGGSDVWARAWYGEFSKIIKVPVVINNQGGASSMMALIEADSAPPDGHTMTVVSHSMLVGTAINSNAPVDLFKNFTLLGGFGHYSSIVVVEQSSPFQTIDDLINHAKKNPGKLKCSDGGAAMISHFTFELLKQQAKLNIVMVPFKAAPEAVTALLGKHVDLAIIPPQPALGFIKSGRVRILLSTQKQKDYPNVPSFAEKGFKEAGINAWLGLAVSSRVPKELQKKLADTFEMVAKDPKVMAKLETLKYTPDYANGAEFLTIMKRDFENIVKVAKQAGIGE